MLIEKIYNSLIEKEKKELDINDYHTSPSTIIDCNRKQYYRWAKTPESNPLEKHTYLKFEMGNAIHELVGRLILATGEFEIIEKEVDKEIYYKGIKFKYRLDFKLRHIKSGEVFILEVKSTYGKGNVEQEAKPEHTAQLYCYMEFEKVENGMLFYINRDNAYMNEFQFTMPELKQKHETEVEAQILKRVILRKEIESKATPAREYQIVLKKDKKTGIISDEFQKDCVKYKSDWRCSYCQYRNHCWAEVFVEMQIEGNNFYIDNLFIEK